MPQNLPKIIYAAKMSYFENKQRCGWQNEVRVINDNKRFEGSRLHLDGQSF